MLIQDVKNVKDVTDVTSSYNYKLVSYLTIFGLATGLLIQTKINHDKKKVNSDIEKDNEKKETLNEQLL